MLIGLSNLCVKKSIFFDNRTLFPRKACQTFFQKKNDLRTQRTMGCISELLQATSYPYVHFNGHLLL